MLRTQHAPVTFGREILGPNHDGDCDARSYSALVFALMWLGEWVCERIVVVVRVGRRLYTLQKVYGTKIIRYHK